MTKLRASCKWLHNVRISQSAIAALMLITFFCQAAPVNDDQKKIYIDEQLRLAEGLKNRGNYKIALDEYQNIIRRFQDDLLAADAWVGLAETYCLMENYQQGILVYETFLKKYPDIKTADYVRIAYAQAIIRSGDASQKDKAISIISEIEKNAIEEKLKDFAVYSMGKVYAESGNASDAEKEFQKLAGGAIKSQEDIYKIHGRIELALLIRKTDIKRALAILENLAAFNTLEPAQKLAVTEVIAGILSENKDFSAAAEKYKELYLSRHGTAEGEEALIKMVENLYLFGNCLDIIKESEGYLNDTKSEENRTRLLYYISLACEKENDNARAEVNLLKIVSSDSTPSDLMEKSRFLLVKVLMKQEKFDKAIKETSKGIGAGKTSSAAKVELVKEILKIDEPEYAPKLSTLLETALKSASDEYEKSIFTYERGLLSARSGKFDEAVKFLNGVSHPEMRPYSLFEKGKCLEKLGKADEAAATYDSIISGFPSSKIAGSVALKSAIIRIEAGQNDIAEQILSKLLGATKSPEVRPEVLFYLGFINIRKEKFEEAKKYFLEASESAKENPEMASASKIYLCWTYLLQKKWAEAEKTASAFVSDEVKMRNADPAFLLLLGKNFLGNGNPYFAGKCFSALSLSSDLNMRNEGIFHLALVNKKLGKTKEAIDNLKQLEKTDPIDPDLYSRVCVSLGDILRDSGQGNEASAFYEKCLELPKNRTAATRARLGLAKLLSLSPEHLERAASYAMQVIVLSEDPETTYEAMILQIDTLLKLGKKEEAKATLDELKKKFPEFLDRKEAKELIQKFGK